MFTSDSWIYRSGDIFLSPRTRAFLKQYIIGDDHTLFYISYWSILHMISGIVFGLLWPNLLAGFAVHTLWEAWQILIGMTPITTARGFIDVNVDTAMFMFGMWAAISLTQGKGRR
jgi:hypothetical protein